MKISIDIDCTPEEARAFLGLPDVKPMQDRLMADLQERMAASLRAMEPAEMLPHLAPRQPQGLRADVRRLRPHGAAEGGRLGFSAAVSGGRCRNRTCDIFDVNEALYR